jgi:hypothetical protein
MAEGEILRDPVFVRFIHHFGRAQRSAAFGAFAGQQMPPAGTGPQHLACGRDLETFGHRFFCFDTFGTAHNLQSFDKRARNIEGTPLLSKREFAPNRPLGSVIPGQGGRRNDWGSCDSTSLAGDFLEGFGGMQNESGNESLAGSARIAD